MKIQSWLGASFLALFLVVSSAVADQVDDETRAAAPAGVMVRVNPTSRVVEVFRAPTINRNIINLSTEEKNAAAQTVISVQANRIGEIRASSRELDNESSTETWRGRWNGYGWGWYGRGYGAYGAYSPYYNPWLSTAAYYPGYFGYQTYRYTYAYSYPYYNNCYVGWYY